MMMNDDDDDDDDDDCNLLVQRICASVQTVNNSALITVQLRVVVGMDTDSMEVAALVYSICFEVKCMKNVNYAEVVRLFVLQSMLF